MWTTRVVLCSIAALGAAGCGDGSDAGGSGGNASCPLDADGKARIAALVGGSVGDASWITSNTHGHGIGAGRGFGGGVPLTTIGVLYAATMAEACAAAKVFDKSCDGGQPEEPVTAYQRCTQLECEGAGLLSAKVWLEPLPITVPADPAPGNTTVEAYAQSVRFEESGAQDVKLTWEGNANVSVSDGFAAERTVAGSANVTPTAVEDASWTVELAQAAPKPMVADVALTSSGPAGTIAYEGAAIGTVGGNGISWAGVCSD